MEPKNKNKGLILTLVLAIIVTVGVTAYVYISSLCTLDGQSVCTDKDTGYFLIEDDAKVVVQVESENQGNALITKWNELHPENGNALTFVVKPTLSIQNLKNGLETDVAILSQNDGAYFMQNFKNLGGRASSTLGDSIPALLQDSINAQGFYFVANSVKGPLFVYNKTLMDELGYSTEDADKSGLPDIFESWEKIMELSNDLSDKPSVVFPLTFEDQNYFYPFLTGGRWTLNFTKNGSNPEFSSNEFKDGLELISEMGKTVWDKNTASEIVVEDDSPTETSLENTNDESHLSNETDDQNGTNVQSDGTGNDESDIVVKELENKAASLKWQYESSFFEGKSLFTIASDFEIFDKYEAASNAEYIYAPFPLYKEHRLNPVATVEGYVVNSKTLYPSAATEAIRILRSPEFVTEFNEYTGKIPVYHRNHIEDVESISKDLMDKIIAYSYSDALPVMALNNNPEVLSRSIYDDIDLMPILSKLFDGELTVEEAQEQIVLLSKDWLEKNDIIEEE